MAAATVPPNPPDDYLKQAMVKQLAAGEAVFDFAVQFQTDPDAMPIEDPGIAWDEKVSPFLKVATLTIPAGPLGRHAPMERQGGDILRALEAARAIGRLDAGQAAVACEGLILALEAQEGTDAMLERVASLPRALRGARGDPRGVLAKACKPGQELRVDLPTIGPRTVHLAAAAGLCGLVGEVGRLLILERLETVRLADELGLFLFGVPPAP